MAILVSRNPSEVNQHQGLNGLEWSRDEQNRLAGSVEAAQARANLRTEIGVLQIERGDTLGAVVKGLTGALNWSQRVDYRSNRITANKPRVLSEANLIYPDQFVWVENEVIIVADTLPTGTVSPTIPSTVPQPLPPNPGVNPVPAAPAVVPTNSNWRARITPPQPNTFNVLPPATRRILRSDFPTASRENFETSNLETNALPPNITSLVALANRSITVPAQVPFLINRDLNMPSQGVHYNSGGGFNYTTNFVGRVDSVTPIRSDTVILLNLSGGPTSISPPQTNSAEFGSTLLNEFSHSVTNQLTDEYIRRRSLQLVGQPERNIISPDAMIEEMLVGFSHPYVPSGIYNFASFNELQSDTFSMSVFPESIQGRYLVYGEGPLRFPSYDLNRDFTAFHLSAFLRDNGYGNHTMAHINQMFRRLHNADNIGDTTEFNRLIDAYHLEDPNFFAYIQPRFQAVGEAFYTHLSNKINAL